MKKALLDIYQKLYDHFGPRGWWPAETPFEVCVGAILTQNVAWRNVVKAIDALRKEGLLEADSLYLAPDEKVAELIRPTRYYNQKTRRLKDFCSLVVNRYSGSLESLLALPAGDLRRVLLGIKGIGKETADSIILYAARKPVFVVDAYTARIFGRLGIIPPGWSYDSLQSFFTENLPEKVDLFNEYHALIDGAGNRYCSGSTPRCGECPLGEMCKVPNPYFNGG
ncbi:MAG: endonuclease [Peptococcaceae bacterium BICA1-7]|nr:MAG: endonuclease [Peptococcaceae bacterium BICA1-7]HBV99070.1 endonuclease [Desulfotomaculum sp.]